MHVNFWPILSLVKFINSNILVAQMMLCRTLAAFQTGLQLCWGMGIGLCNLLEISKDEDPRRRCL